MIGSIRRDCTDHIIALSESQLRRLLRSYITYYNRSRCHMALDGDAPQHRGRQETTDGPVVAIPQVGGLHHRYVRAAYNISSRNARHSGDLLQLYDALRRDACLQGRCDPESQTQ